MPRTRIRAALPAAALLALASAPLAAQDLGAVESLFEDVSAVAVFLQTGGVANSDEVTGDGLFGAGTEVLIDLNTGARWDMELGLGASFLRGYGASEPSLDLRTSLRAFPTVTLYVTPASVGQLSLYTGVSFGLVELWNAQAYDEAGNAWDIEARTFELGGSLGLYAIPVTGIGLFVEGGYRHRDFSSVKWTVPGDETLPQAWPRSFDFSGYYAQAGVQLRVKEDEEGDPNDGITPPAPAGVWTLERMDGGPLPALADSSRAGWGEVLHGVLRLAPDSAAGERGRWTLELQLRQRAERGEAAFRQAVESGAYTAAEAAGREHVLTLVPDAGAGPHRAERLAGRLYLTWNGHVLVFAPGTGPAPAEQ